MLRKSIGVCAGLCLLVGGVCGLPAARAQASGTNVVPPPKVLVLDLEFLKPGKFGSAHQKTESAFVDMMRKANWPDHYTASQAISGPPRTLFVFGYDSFADLEKELKAENGGPLSAQLDAAFQADGELLTSMSRGIFVYHEEMSVNAPCAIATMRYFQISRIKIRPGQTKNWQDFIKTWKDAEAKTNPDAHIAVFSEVYGMESSGVYLLIHPMKSLSEVDDMHATNDKFRQNVGDWAHYEEMLGAIVESGQTNLYAFDPAMSYVSDDWVKADPTFWKHK